MEREEELAKDYADIATGDYVVVVDEIEELTQQQKDTQYRGFDEGELHLPVWIGKAVEPCDEKDVDAEVTLHRYRVRNGNINTGTWFAGVLSDNTRWIVKVKRSAICLVNPAFMKKQLKLQVRTLKALGELQHVPMQWIKDPRKNGRFKLVY